MATGGGRNAYTRLPAGVRRRDVLAGLALGLATLVRPSAFRASARADAAPAPQRPRYWINIVPSGGMDSIWTLDPKTASDVARGVDVPYGADAIVHAGKLRLGPHFGTLARLAPQLTVVNGVLVRTANHFTGFEQATRLRVRTTMRTPAVFDILGAHRDSQALAHVILSAPNRQAQTLSFLGTSTPRDFGGGIDVFAHVESLDPDQRRALARHVGDAARSLRRRGTLDDAGTRAVDNLGQVAAMLDRLADVPALQVEPWFEATGEIGSMPADIQRLVWLIEHDLAATVTVFLSGAAWDTHGNGTTRQSMLNPVLATALARVIDELARRHNRHGVLADQTAIVVGSEIGRFPYINDVEGKDHFPQISMLLAGPALASGRTFGATGREMEALAVSTRTGAVSPSGRRLSLDDVGYTLLSIGGVRPEAYGLAAHKLRFLEPGTPS